MKKLILILALVFTVFQSQAGYYHNVVEQTAYDWYYSTNPNDSQYAYDTIYPDNSVTISLFAGTYLSDGYYYNQSYSYFTFYALVEVVAEEDGSGPNISTGNNNNGNQTSSGTYAGGLTYDLDLYTRGGKAEITASW